MAKQEFSIAGFIVGAIAKLLYFSSLTALIPFCAMLLTQKPVNLPATMHFLPLTALALLGFSVLIMLFHTRNIAHTLASLGWVTLLPGLGALGFMIFNRDAVFNVLNSMIFGFGKLEPYVTAYLDSALPKVWVVIAVYILIGFILVYIAGRIESEHAITSYIKRVFGPRARIYR